MSRIGSVTSSVEGEEEDADIQDGITDYEKQRLQTIKRNQSMLASLQVKDLATSLEESSVAATAKAAGKRKKAILEINSGGRRRSQRLSSIKSPKLVDWSSENSQSSVGGSESEPDGSFFSSKPGGKLKQKAKKKVKKKISLAELEDIEKKKKEDAEYEPSEVSNSENSFEDEEEPDEEVTRDLPRFRKRKTPAKKPGRTSKSPRKRTISLNSPSLVLHSPPGLPVSSDMEDDELALQQALALSMDSSLDIMSPKASGVIKGKQVAENSRSGIGSKAGKKRPNKKGKDLFFEESEIDAFFVAIVGSKEGRLSIRHLESAVSAHDFTWTNEELNDMINIFDKDDDGQLNLAEFRSMAQRSKLMEGC